MANFDRIKNKTDEKRYRRDPIQTSINWAITESPLPPTLLTFFCIRNRNQFDSMTTVVDLAKISDKEVPTGDTNSDGDTGVKGEPVDSPLPSSSSPFHEGEKVLISHGNLFYEAEVLCLYNWAFSFIYLFVYLFIANHSFSLVLSSFSWIWGIYF